MNVITKNENRTRKLFGSSPFLKTSEHRRHCEREYREASQVGYRRCYRDEKVVRVVAALEYHVPAGKRDYEDKGAKQQGAKYSERKKAEKY